MKIARLLALSLTTALLAINLTGCLFIQPKATAITTTAPADKGSNAPTNDQLTWQGSILEIYDGDTAFLAAVDAEYQTMLGDKASVSLYDDAVVVRDDTGETIDLATVLVGTPVIVTITGGIRESYPVQVSAIEVRVILND